MTATAAGHSSLMRRVTLATGVELAVHQLGDGEPVLLLHAWGETHRSFDRLVPLLPRTLHLVVPDQRGVGDSAKPAHGYALHDAVGDVIALLDALGLDASWLVGTSSGGYLAEQVTVDYPDRVRGLVLIGAPSNLHQASPSPFLDLLSSFHDPVTRGDIDALNGALPLHSPVPAAFLDDQMTAALTIPKSVWSASIQGLLTAPPPIQSGPITVRTLDPVGSRRGRSARRPGQRIGGGDRRQPLGDVRRHRPPRPVGAAGARRRRRDRLHHKATDLSMPVRMFRATKAAGVK